MISSLYGLKPRELLEQALSATAREPAYTHTEVGVKFSPVEAGYDVTFYEEKGGIPK